MFFKNVQFVYICFMKQLENTGDSFIGHIQFVLEVWHTKD